MKKTYKLDNVVKIVTTQRQLDKLEALGYKEEKEVKKEEETQAKK